ncbi:PTS galactitol transporter subunit IIC [Brachyspira catarrhinii]|uniref:PTS galactitol transporter subunit IIC n=1 Tax=Brachyspira catarrhinii TaxID=2528966 RepID=A0ABY2TQ54_9SPIR|nr:PTS transporter subunit IIC [Brachyspira catarrhinii]TKZ34825.1 PTS galactitol transporter subunit IIC [Brachyspira catarrhinii]
MNTIITITNFITSLGSTVMLPIIILILGLILKMKLSKAIVSALTIGVGFVGLGLIINLLVGALDPATKILIDKFNLNLVALDVGWPVGSAIAFGTTIGALIIPIIFLFNIILLSLKLTKTLDVDIWNYWHFAFSGSIAYLWSGNNLIIGIVVALIHCFISFKIADITASKVQTFFNIPGISIPQGFATTTVPIVFILDKIIDKIPIIKDINFNIESIQKRFGILGLPLVMGTIIGLILGVLSYGFKKESLNLAIQMGAIMVLCPRIISIFMEGFAPVSEAAREFMQKRFKNQEFNIGLDSAIMIGHPTTILVGAILIPIALILAFILPGNKVLPFADLASTAFFVAFVTPLVKGNFFRTLIYGIIIMIVVLYVSSGFAEGLTTIARNIGYEFPANSSMITGLSEGNWIAYILTNIARLITGN